MINDHVISKEPNNMFIFPNLYPLVFTLPIWFSQRLYKDCAPILNQM